MAIRDTINANITTNGANAITGAIMNTTLEAMCTDYETLNGNEASARAAAVTAEAAARAAADETLQDTIDDEVAGLENADTAEATARAAADTALQANITSEASTRASADTALQTNITNEATARAAADALLLPIANVKQVTGSSTSNVMSQKAITDELANYVNAIKQRVIAEALDALALALEGVEDKLANGISKLKVGHLIVDRSISGLNENGTFCLKGAGAPSASIVPTNWDFDTYGDWKGIPQFIGQEYCDTANGIFYKAKGVSAVADWSRITNA